LRDEGGDALALLLVGVPVPLEGGLPWHGSAAGCQGGADPHRVGLRTWDRHTVGRSWGASVADAFISAQRAQTVDYGARHAVNEAPDHSPDRPAVEYLVHPNEVEVWVHALTLSAIR
jgi:hypothetical protein